MQKEHLKRRKLVYSTVIIVLFLSACKERAITSSSDVVETAFFSINMPSDTKDAYAVIYAEDSLSGKLYKGTDTTYFDIAYEVNTLTEREPKVLFVPSGGNEDKRALIDTNIVDTSGLIIAEREDFDLDFYKKQNIFYSSNNGLIFKNTFPRVGNNGGIVGVYCDSIKHCYGGNLKFNLYKETSGDLLVDSMFIKSFNTIKFKDKPMCY
jgi:hypothetical protein